jgi:hypothetical protein
MSVKRSRLAGGDLLLHESKFTLTCRFPRLAHRLLGSPAATF